MLAEVPSAPANLHRAEWDSLPAGSIMLRWSLPEDEGGDPVTGYKLYVDSVLIEDASGSSTMNEYIFTNLSVGAPYQLQVAAVNSIGESPAASLTLLAASVPQKLAQPQLVTSNAASITIQAIAAFDGGDKITHYVFMRDDGPLTDFQTRVQSSSSFYTFEGLEAGKMYRVKVAAINSIG